MTLAVRCIYPTKQPLYRILKELSLYMDYLDKVVEKLKEWAQKVIELLLGPEAETEAELIPIPVDDTKNRRYR